MDSGRELRITAGFKHIKAKKGTALFDLIEEYEEKPMETPLWVFLFLVHEIVESWWVGRFMFETQMFEIISL